LKSQKNDEFWRALQLGLPLPAPKTTFAFDRFGSMLAGTGVRVNKQGNQLRLTPLTDAEITKLAPMEVAKTSDPKKPLFVRAKDLRPEKDGLFDPTATGGTTGTKWSHLKLAEPVVNPMFERPVQALLGVTGRQYEDTLRTEGGRGIKKQLATIDVNRAFREAQEQMKDQSGAQRDKTIRKMKYLNSLKHAGLKADEAFVLSKIPVVPPVYRPILPGKTGALQISDPNHLYRDLFVADRLLRKIKTAGLPPKEQAAARQHVYDATKALFGLADPVSPQAKARNVQGFIARIAGTGRSPKSGFFQSKLVKKRQDVSGRGTIVPDATLSLDEVGLPEDMAWDMYKPFVIRRMVQRGHSAMDARDKVDEKHPTARDFLQQEVDERPVLLNRAPSLRRYNVLAAYPKLVPGKSIRIHELFAPIQAGDFDGDTMQVHVPVGKRAVDEAKDLTLSKMLLGDQYKQQTMVVPQHESVLGIYHATNQKPKGPTRTFKNKAEAVSAYNRNEIGLDTPVQIGRKK
jgi:DNA-directed RNA polymerase subunit beta'